MTIEDYSTGDDGKLNDWRVMITATDFMQQPEPTSMSYVFTQNASLAIDSSTAKESTLAVSGVEYDPPGGYTPEITDIRVYLYIEHSWVTDLLVYIQHVNSGITVDLYDGQCNSVCNFDNIDAWFDEDDWVSDVCGQCNQANCAVCNGPYRAIDRLTDFHGLDPNSDWVVGASDSFSVADNGVLQQWKIEFTVEWIPDV